VLGLARNDHPGIRIRLEMNSARTDLDHASKEYEEVYYDKGDVCFGIEANEGAQALRSAIEESLNSGYQGGARLDSDVWRDATRNSSWGKKMTTSIIILK
jgi:hypothetical protein